MTTSTTLSPALRQTSIGSLLFSTASDYVLKVGDRRFGVGASVSPCPVGPSSAYLIRLPVVIAQHAIPETVEEAALGDVLDLGSLGRWEIVEERIPGGRVQDKHVTLKHLPPLADDEEFDGFWEETE